MNTHLTRRLLLALAAATGLCTAAPTLAQKPWPSGPIKIVLPLPPGGSPDTSARLVAESLRAHLGQPVVIENKPGASGALGLKAVAMAPADGLTLAYVISSNVTTDLLQPNFDLQKELEPVTMEGSAPYLLLVKADAPYKTLADLVAAAKKNPGKLSYGSGGPGSALHMTQAQFFDAAGLQLLHVPYKGGMAANVGLAGGEVDVSVAVFGSAKALLDSGRVRALAVTAPQRLAQLPAVPTVQEAIGLPFTSASWSGYAVRKGTPPQIVAALHKAITEAMQEPAYQRYAASTGGNVTPSASPQAFAELIRAQYSTEAALIKKLGIKAE